MYGKMSKQKNKLLAKSLGPFFQEKWYITTRKQVCYAVFHHFGAPPNGPEKIDKGPQVGRMYGLMSELKNKPLTKYLGPFF
jgi:hypothetical protein